MHSYSPIPELNRLNEFQERYGPFADGFSLTEYNDVHDVEFWSSDPEFLSRLIPFATANYTGSVYALWRVDNRADLADLPVIAFGDEGGEFVIARNVRELFQLLAYDAEISVFADSEAYFVRSDGHEPSRYHRRYLRWLHRTFGLEPVTDPDRVVAAANAEYGERFETWFAGFTAHLTGDS